VHAFLERAAGREKPRAVRLPADPATKSARSIRRVLLNVEEIPQDDKIGSLADALIGESDKEEAARIATRLEQLTAAVRQRLASLK